MIKLVLVHINALPGTKEENDRIEVNFHDLRSSHALLTLRRFEGEIVLVAGWDMKDAIRGARRNYPKIALVDTLYIDTDESRIAAARETGIPTCLTDSETISWIAVEGRRPKEGNVWHVRSFHQAVQVVAAQAPMY